MENFIIQNTNDFNNYLMQLISLEESTDESENKCLITGEPLNKHSVTLMCKHSFNYVPLINEIRNQKKINSLEVTHLRAYHIKCPYCRNIQNGVIPYCPEVFNIKLKGINWPPAKLYRGNKCEAIYKSGKRKGEVCNKPCCGKYCTRHKNYCIKVTNKKTKKTVSEKITCTAILMSGKRKGQICGAICKSNASKTSKLCGRHNKLLNKT